MNTLTLLHQCIQDCESMLREIDADSCVRDSGLGGVMRGAYESARQNQLARLKEIYYRLCSLRDMLISDGVE